MSFQTSPQLQSTLDALRSLGLLCAHEQSDVLNLCSPGGFFADVLWLAETIHLHIKVDDTERLPVSAFLGASAVFDHAKIGFVKYRFAGQVNAIFSHIKVSQDELIETATCRRSRPFLDHIGIAAHLKCFRNRPNCCSGLMLHKEAAAVRSTAVTHKSLRSAGSARPAMRIIPGFRSSLRTGLWWLIYVLVAGVLNYGVQAHGVEHWGQPLDWHNDQIDQVIGSWSTGQKVSIDGKECLAGGSLSFKVNDEYAFDIDETVWLTVEFYLGSAEANLEVSYDRSDAAGRTTFSGEDAVKQVRLPKYTKSHLYTQVISLEHARLANLGFEGSDFTITSAAPDSFRICSISLKRTYTTPVPKSFGVAVIEIVDETDQPTPVRMGIYDSSGHLPLPSDEALALNNMLIGGASRVIGLDSRAGVLPVWPIRNRSVFYTDGKYHTRLPVGGYQMIVAKGPEYRLSRQRFTVRANATNFIKIKLQRWADMAAKGWYSGEDHIHYARNGTQDDHDLLLFAQAEDLRVANVLQFDDVLRTYIPHYDWKPVLTDSKKPIGLVPGQEGPRTGSLGHVALLNIKEPFRDPAHYLSYHRAFESAHAQGGLAGYAHVVGFQGASGCPSPECSAQGMAIDVPFGLVDFAEIMSLHYTDTSIWFDFLNLGYKLTPTAGTDYPWGGVPGTVRNYVRVDKPLTTQAWFDELKKGRTFVTDGPMLEISVNGQSMGSEIHVKNGEALLFNGKATVNPDIDVLSSLELIEQGKVVKTALCQNGAPQIELRHSVSAKDGTWFVLRARGKKPYVVALSAPIYVWVDGRTFWRQREVPSIVAKLKSQMQKLLESSQLDTTQGYELLKQRIDQANVVYDDLVRRAAASLEQPTQ